MWSLVRRTIEGRKPTYGRHLQFQPRVRSEDRVESQMLFDIRRNVHRRNGPDVTDVILRPRQKLSAGPCVRFAGVQVPDPGREKLEELGRGVFARIGQDRWNCVRVAEGQCVHSGVKECPILECWRFIFWSPTDVS
jgi:hypothetical protein